MLVSVIKFLVIRHSIPVTMPGFYITVRNIFYKIPRMHPGMSWKQSTNETDRGIGAMVAPYVMHMDPPYIMHIMHSGVVIIIYYKRLWFRDSILNC